MYCFSFTESYTDIIGAKRPLILHSELSDVVQRVNLSAVYQHLEMKVRTCGVTCGADTSYLLTLIYILTCSYAYRARLHVSISGGDSVTVVDNYGMTVA